MAPGSTTCGCTSPNRAWRGTHRVPSSTHPNGDSFGGSCLQNTARRAGFRHHQMNEVQFGHDAARQREGIEIVKAHGAREFVEDGGEARPGVEEAKELLAAGIFRAVQRIR